MKPASLPPSRLERLRTGAGRRALGLLLALLIEGILLLVLLSVGVARRPESPEKAITVVNLTPSVDPEEEPEPTSPAREQRVEEQPVPQPPAAQESSAADEPPVPQPVRPAPTMATPTQVPTPIVPVPAPRQAPPAVSAPPAPVRPTSPGRAVYGPPDTGRPSSRDTARVGTAPNGEPLYAAAWYREPTEEQLRGYLSTASGPGWGLIACRTAPDYRVEDCVGLDEYPQGSQMLRAVLAAAWQFQVLPPRRGGASLVGSWVRIRIDYGLKRR